jgi:uncharacterized MnhB-related membrane protein
MTALQGLQGALLVLVAFGGLGVVLARDLLRQTLLVSVYGLLMGLLFLALQAPDVALSSLVVGAVALPLMILLAMAKVKGQGE